MKMSGKKRNEQRQPDGEMMKLRNQGFNWQGLLAFDLNSCSKHMKMMQTWKRCLLRTSKDATASKAIVD